MPRTAIRTGWAGSATTGSGTTGWGVIESVQLGLTLQWREVEVLGAHDGESALDLVEKETPDVVLLDIGLPGKDGFEVLRELRAFWDVPVVMLTARDDAMDKVKGLELGADDYVTKPFNHLELMARIRAVLRRHDMPAPASRTPSFKSATWRSTSHARRCACAASGSS